MAAWKLFITAFFFRFFLSFCFCCVFSLLKMNYLLFVHMCKIIASLLQLVSLNSRFLSQEEVAVLSLYKTASSPEVYLFNYLTLIMRKG